MGTVKEAGSDEAGSDEADSWHQQSVKSQMNPSLKSQQRSHSVDLLVFSSDSDGSKTPLLRNSSIGDFLAVKAHANLPQNRSHGQNEVVERDSSKLLKVTPENLQNKMARFDPVNG